MKHMKAFFFFLDSVVWVDMSPRAMPVLQSIVPIQTGIVRHLSVLFNIGASSRVIISSVEEKSLI